MSLRAGLGKRPRDEPRRAALSSWPCRYPVILRRFELRLGSGGRGRFRGGDGVIRELLFREEALLSVLTERRAFRPYGLHGERISPSPTTSTLRQVSPYLPTKLLPPLPPEPPSASSCRGRAWRPWPKSADPQGWPDSESGWEDVRACIPRGKDCRLSCPISITPEASMLWKVNGVAKITRDPV